MRNLHSFAAAAVAAGFLAFTPAPAVAGAAITMAPVPVETGGLAEPVQLYVDRRYRYRPYRYGRYNRYRPYRYGRYNRYRPYRRYRRNRGAAIGLGIAGALLGGAIVANQGNLGRHHAYCEGRYRSYRRSDGTFQPYGNRPRRRCNSPYDGV